jgi:hypothetical protein
MSQEEMQEDYACYRAQILELNHEMKQLKEAIEAALRISELWMRPHAPEEFEGEAAALWAMKLKFLKALKGGV